MAFAVVTPLIVLNFLGYFEFAPAIVMGAFLNAPGDIPGSLKRTVNAILIMAVISFCVSLISVYGFRASMVSFSGLLAMVLAFAVQKETAYDILIHVLLMGCGGLWYLLVSFMFRKLSPKKDEVQFLSETRFRNLLLL